MLKISPVVRRDTTIPTLTLNIVTKGKIMKDKDKRGGFGGALGGLGVAVAMVLCCADPILIAGGVFAALGGWTRNPLVTILGAAIVAVALFNVIRRRRSGQACSTPQDEPSSTTSARSTAVIGARRTRDER